MILTHTPIFTRSPPSSHTHSDQNSHTPQYFHIHTPIFSHSQKISRTHTNILTLTNIFTYIRQFSHLIWFWPWNLSLKMIDDLEIIKSLIYYNFVNFRKVDLLDMIYMIFYRLIILLTNQRYANCSLLL